MKVIYNNILPFPGFAAINLFGILFVRENVILTSRVLNHERIHTAQMKELLYVFFYLLYFLEWIIRLFKYRSKSYYNISFEREAYGNDGNPVYLKSRKFFAWTKFIVG
ncbi:MAG: hypothetical protein LBJ72_11995 [Dysgonamonadaceae bacterium]|jgi:hypothetical protein|nr:hypothetical protein [Dysgonamonadaceae bacterium]